jgi:small subunit ribosomal protein S17
MSEETARRARTLSGRVSSDKMDKTVVVVVDRQVKHPLYGKYVSRRTKVRVHDEGNECREGDLVAIEECRPLAKTKAWRLVKILSSASA